MLEVFHIQLKTFFFSLDHYLNDLVYWVLEFNESLSFYCNYFYAKLYSILIM